MLVAICRWYRDPGTYQYNCPHRMPNISYSSVPNRANNVSLWLPLCIFVFGKADPESHGHLQMIVEIPESIPVSLYIEYLTLPFPHCSRGQILFVFSCYFHYLSAANLWLLVRQPQWHYVKSSSALSSCALCPLKSNWFSLMCDKQKEILDNPTEHCH